MNYRHIYHAGSFSDLIKHTTLIAVLNTLRQKDKPYAVLDAFAGLGIYDLSSEQSMKTKESNDGIKKVLEFDYASCPALIKQFIDVIQSLKQNFIASSNHYPGSPWIISSMLRPVDKLIATELHPQDYAHLKHLFSKSKQVAIHHLDAYNAIKAFLPFKENRGLIFLDPPFESKNEFDKLVNALKIIKYRAANICTMIWYPIKEDRLTRNFHKSCAAIGFKETLIIEFEVKNLLIPFAKNFTQGRISSEIEIRKEAGPGLTKCGILITNPPFIYEEIKGLLHFLKKNIYNDRVEFRIYTPDNI